jgi:TPR repeat protein/formylglycine-generating enzyme required for sulfatase activity
MKYCPKCSLENAEGQKFCSGCGASLQGDLEKLLESLGLGMHWSLFERNDLKTIKDLRLLDDQNFSELGIPYGDTVRIRRALESSGPQVVATSVVEESPLARLKTKASQGDLDSMFELGELHVEGSNGVDKDFIEAAAWYRKAAEKGHANAQYKYGEALYYGRGVEEDERESAKWLRMAIRQGHENAKSEYNERLEEECFAYLLDSAEQGNGESQYRLGCLFYHGEQGHPVDKSQAASWFRKASAQGIAAAQFILGSMNFSGDGIRQDPAEGRRLVAAAAAQGYAEAMELLHTIEAPAAPPGQSAPSATTQVPVKVVIPWKVIAFGVVLFLAAGVGVALLIGNQAKKAPTDPPNQSNLAENSSATHADGSLKGQGVAKASPTQSDQEKLKLIEQGIQNDDRSIELLKPDGEYDSNCSKLKTGLAVLIQDLETHMTGAVYTSEQLSELTRRLNVARQCDAELRAEINGIAEQRVVFFKDKEKLVSVRGRLLAGDNQGMDQLAQDLLKQQQTQKEVLAQLSSRSQVLLPKIAELFSLEPVNPGAVRDKTISAKEDATEKKPESGNSDSASTASEPLKSSPPVMTRVDGGTLPQSSKLGELKVPAFFISKTELSWEEWKSVRDWSSEHGYDIGQAGAASGPRHPVRNVSWYEAVKWCNAKSEQQGLHPVYTVGGEVYRKGELTPFFDRAADGYRLPTESEWEWTARGGNQSRGYRFSGSDNADDVAWHWDNSSGSEVDIYQGRGTWPVAQKKPNELGIYDMSGNVWEWCWDQVHGSYRAIRGGRWSFPAERCSVDYRENYGVPGGHADHYGFRIVRSQGSQEVSGNNSLQSAVLLYLKALERKDPASVLESLAERVDYYGAGIVPKKTAFEDIKGDWKRYSEYRSSISEFHQIDQRTCEFVYDYSLYQGDRKREGKLFMTVGFTDQRPPKISLIKAKTLSAR